MLFACFFAGSAIALTGERFPELTMDNMTPAKRAVVDPITSGPRKRFGGPFNSWLRSPELAERLQKVGEYLRYNTSLDNRINEMAIIITAQHWRSQFEWFVHAPIAIKAGLDPKIVESIGVGRKPDNMKDIVWEFATQLRRNRSVDGATYAHAIGMFGEKGIMDLIAVNQHHDLVSMTLNVAKVYPPAGENMPF